LIIVLHSTTQKRTFPVTVPVMASDHFKVGSDGLIKNASSATGVDASYSVRATTPDGPIVMQERIFQLSALDCSYQRGLIAEMIKDVMDPTKVKAVEKHFSLRGDMERLLPVYAAAIAEDELLRDGGTGILKSNPWNCTLDVTRQRAELDREARLTASRTPRK
jgi:hypothetical protein